MVFQIKNKGIVHVTEDIKDNPDHRRLIEIANLGVPSLVVSYLYSACFARSELQTHPPGARELDHHVWCACKAEILYRPSTQPGKRPGEIR